MLGNLSNAKLGTIYKASKELFEKGYYMEKRAAISSFMVELGSLTSACLTAMGDRDFVALFQLPASSILGFKYSVSHVLVERAENNEVYFKTSSDVLPINLFAFCPATFPYLCSTIGSVSTTPSVNRRLR